ncbi:MAG: putative metal-binding motif-containing protein [Bacteroidetes bacterium]|nr:putative metal-binding motif-containing protein [Bacteroidota bacterium]
MKRLVISIFLLSTIQISLAQVPAIEWQNTIGGDLYDWLYSIEQTSDGGYILGGHSESGVSGDKADSSRGGSDYWIVKLNSSGEIEWQNTIGGDNQDQVYDIKQTLDGGYIVGGYSSSSLSGEKSENYIGINSNPDYWVVKLDSLGEIEWQNTIGGDQQDYLWSVGQTIDGGYILGGLSESGLSGDKTEEKIGYSDYWIVKLNSLGEIEWQNTIGGDLDDWLHSMEQTVDGGYILVGTSYSNISGDKTENCFGFNDYWVVKLDSLGEIEWQNTIGGNLYDEVFSIQQTIDFGYIIGGQSNSDFSGSKNESCLGYYDYWVVKLDSFGEIEWQNTIGGNNWDIFFSVKQTSTGGYIVGGCSYSNISGDKTEDNHGQTDYWIVKLSELGEIDWQSTIGGISLDVFYELEPTNDGGYILAGLSQSGISGDKTEVCIGQYDYWVIKLYPDCLELQETCNGIDDDCDGDIDEGFTLNTYYLDADVDNFGNSLIDTLSCSIVDGYILDNTDCDDSNSDIYPGAEEFENGIDDNCDNVIDEGFSYINNINLIVVIIYPNPSGGRFTIKLQNWESNEILVKVDNSIGEEIYLRQFFNTQSIEIKLPESFSGIAIMTIFDESNMISKVLYILE